MALRGETTHRRAVAAAFLVVFSLAGCSRPKAPAPGPVGIGPGDTPDELEAKAARVVPYERQIAWQALEFQAFVHFGMNTFTDREWGEGTEDPKLFDPDGPRRRTSGSRRSRPRGSGV